MSLDLLKNTFNSLPKSSSDLRVICSSLEGVYNTNKIILEALLEGHKTLKTPILFSFEYLDESTFNEIIKGLSSIEKEYTKVTSENVLVDVIEEETISAIKELDVCKNLISILPQSLKDLIIEVEFNLKESINGLVAIPKDILQNTLNLIKEVKEKTLKEVLGQNFNLILKPFLDFDSFIISNEIPTLINLLSDIETCLMNPNGCNKTRDLLVNKETNQLWSQYFLSEFKISKRGDIQIQSFINDDSKISKTNEILKRTKKFTT